MTQYVRVEVAEGRTYTYEWDGAPALKKDEVVVLPSNMVKDREFTGRVVRVMKDKDTDLPLKKVLRRKDEPTLAPEDADLL